MKKTDIIKGGVLLLLILACIWKFMTLSNKESGPVYIQIEPIIDTCEVQKTPQELIIQDITVQTQEFYCALKERNIKYAASLSSERGMYSLMALPIDEIKEFELKGVVVDQHIAEVESTINQKVRALVFLQKKKKGWTINGVIAEK